MATRAPLLRPLFRRTLATSARSSREPHATAAEAASRLLETFAETTSVRRQLIDSNQLQKLSLTLGRTSLSGIDISQAPPPAGTPVPPGHHLVYFTPNGTEAELGPDGSDRTFNPIAPFKRRMWAGGRMQWLNVDLRTGDEVEERTRLLSAVPKKSRSTGDMLLVEVEREFWSPRGLALVDQRSWMFRPEVDLDASTVVADPKPIEVDIRRPTEITDVKGSHDEFPTRLLHWSPVGLFRFSALTFNGHKIHYNDDWTRSVEGHPGAVVHGPLNLINMLDYWRDVHGQEVVVSDISYRAMAPIYAGEQYQIRTAQVSDTDDGRTWEVLVEKNGLVCMKSEVKGAPTRSRRS